MVQCTIENGAAAKAAELLQVSAFHGLGLLSTGVRRVPNVLVVDAGR
jgi:hypothetical protein